MAAAKSTKKIRKFSRPQMIFHWVYGISWILLVLTGIIFLWRADPKSAATGLGPMLQGSVGQGARWLHRVAAIGLMVSPFIWLLDGKTLWPDLKELLSFGKNELKYMMVAPLHYTIGKPALPPQGKYNGGHKLNFYVVILTFIGFVISGMVMWFMRGTVTDDTFHLMQIIHSVSFWLGLVMGILHIYLTMVHPFTSKALGAMLDGYMDLGYAKAEHKLWVDREIMSGKADIIDQGKEGKAS